ncbi:hypothetical protein PSHT_00407 [Puccinia striiformis]|uniref:Tc1-like transposase DDE domain-containing protein n=1 Tax=Puccinia striiformis TaxID=27350 RepID=A0A2S4WNG2_9BASI|nr:hypothetical protein PSHT_00407 [Puccinia striiformis]
MAKASKAVLAQRRRFAREKVERELQKQESSKEKFIEEKKKKVDQSPIVIDSESDDDAVKVLEEIDNNDVRVLHNNNLAEIISDSNTKELAEFQEAEIKARNQANNLVQYYNLAEDDETSEDNSDVTDEDEPDEDLWPLFSGAILPRQDSAKPHQLKSGQKFYQQPIMNANSASTKLSPALVPSSTKCDRKKRQIEALGNNVQMMSRYLICLEPVKAVAVDLAIDPNLEFASLEEDVSADQNHELVDHRLASLLDKRITDPKELQLTSKEKKKKKAHSQWEELDSALNAATLHYRKKEKKDKKFEFPKSMIKNVYLCNNLHLEYTLDGTPCPNATASLSAAQSAIKQRPLSTGPRKPTSGIYLSRSIQREAKNIIKHQRLLEVKRGNQKTHRSLLDNIELRKELFTWAASQVPGHVTPLTFREYTINTVFPKFNIHHGLSRDSATRWMMKLGYRPQEHRKCLYFDGHERPDVLEARKKYIEDFDSHRQQSRIYEGKNLDTAPPVPPEALVDGKETVFIYHDESTIHAKEKPKSSWLLPGTRELRSKNSGRLIHISDFILETTGRLKLSEEQSQGTTIESGDAATIIYPGSTGDKWWDMEQLCHQVSTKAIPIFEVLHPNLQAVFVFDCSSAHGAFSKTALRVQNMNLKPGGKQSWLRDSVTPSDDPLIPDHLCGLPQTFCYDSTHPDPQLAGKPKGIQAILQERGLWQHYTALQLEERKPALKLKCVTCVTSNIRKDALNRSAKLIQVAEETGYLLSQEQCVAKALAAEGHNPEDNPHQCDPADVDPTDRKNCCWSSIISQQSDFMNERPLLQAIIEDAGHICLFLPKFHCELNPIELFWSYIKECKYKGWIT